MARQIEEFRSYRERMNERIVIPHLRHAFDTIDQLRAEGTAAPRHPAETREGEG